MRGIKQYIDIYESISEFCRFKRKRGKKWVHNTRWAALLHEGVSGQSNIGFKMLAKLESKVNTNYSATLNYGNEFLFLNIYDK